MENVNVSRYSLLAPRRNEMSDPRNDPENWTFDDEGNPGEYIDPAEVWAAEEPPEDYD